MLLMPCGLLFFFCPRAGLSLPCRSKRNEGREAPNYRLIAERSSSPAARRSRDGPLVKGAPSCCPPCSTTANSGMGCEPGHSAVALGAVTCRAAPSRCRQVPMPLDATSYGNSLPDCLPCCLHARLPAEGECEEVYGVEHVLALGTHQKPWCVTHLAVAAHLQSSRLCSAMCSNVCVPAAWNSSMQLHTRLLSSQRPQLQPTYSRMRAVLLPVLTHQLRAFWSPACLPALNNRDMFTDGYTSDGERSAVLPASHLQSLLAAQAAQL